MISTKERVITKVIEIIRESGGSIDRYELFPKLRAALPDVRPVHFYQHLPPDPGRLIVSTKGRIINPGPGLLALPKFEETKITAVTIQAEEKDFYEPFANWLMNIIQECTRAIPLGGNVFERKWGTPDVIGIKRDQDSDIVKRGHEVVSAEIKTDIGQIVTGFGQACSYLLFSDKAYLVIPKQTNKGEISQTDALCRIFGIGLVLFDNTNPNDPDFEIRVRPTKHEPDLFYTNKYLKIVESKLLG